MRKKSKELIIIEDLIDSLRGKVPRTQMVFLESIKNDLSDGEVTTLDYNKIVNSILPNITMTDAYRAFHNTENSATRKILSNLIMKLKERGKNEIKSAIDSGDTKQIDQVLDTYRVDINAPDKSKTPLMLALEIYNHASEEKKEGAFKVIKHLVEKGADFNQSTKLLGNNSAYSKATGEVKNYFDKVQKKLNEKVIEHDKQPKQPLNSLWKRIQYLGDKIYNLTRQGVNERKFDQLYMIAEIAKEISVEAKTAIKETQKVESIDGDAVKPSATPVGSKSIKNQQTR